MQKREALISRNSVVSVVRLGHGIKTRLVATIKSGAKSISQEFQPPKVSEEKYRLPITAVGQNFIAKKKSTIRSLSERRGLINVPLHA